MAYISTKNTTLYYKSGAYYVAFTGVREVSVPKQSFEKLDTTTLGDSVKKSIVGIKEVDNIKFKILHDATNKGLMETLLGVEGFFKVAFSDAAGYTFPAFLSSYESSGNKVNGVVEFDGEITITGDATVV